MAEAAAPERQLKRALSAFDLTCIGIGAIIGTGIFALAGTAAAGEQAHAVGSIWKTPVLNFVQSWTTHAPLVFGRPGAGPAVMLSFVVAGIACGFAALCYAELAAMIPVSGSAYTYSYATLGEIIAWTIGWDLILEYAVGNMAVAVGWSGYFVRLCGSLFNLKFPLWLVSDHTTATGIIALGGDTLANYSSTTLPTIAGHAIALNLPALLIVAAVTALLVYGIRESARTNTTIVIIKIAVVMFVIAFGAFLVHPTNWHPFMPTGIGGVMSGAAIVFFAFIGFDAVSTTAENKKSLSGMPIGIIASLIICTVLYVLMAGIITGMRKYTIYLGDPAAVATAFADRPWPRRSSVRARSLVLLQCCSFSNSPNHAFSWPWHATGCCRNISQKFTPGFARRTSQPSGLESPSVASRCLQISGRLLILRTSARFLPSCSFASA